MAYTVTCYKNTGFNAVNIPDSPTLLQSMTSITIPSIDLLQNRFLTSIAVKSAFDDVSDVDYCKIGDMYYIVTGVTMTSLDVAVLSLVPDFITSAGGAASITYLDGITERHTVSDDTMFKYTQADEYMAPREALQVTYGGMLFNSSDVDMVAVESTINLLKLAGQFSGDYDNPTFAGQGITFTDPDSQNYVVVPYTQGVNAGTLYRIGDTEDAPNIESPKTRVYNAESDTVNLALGAVRSLGVESALISQVVYPSQFVSHNGDVSVVTIDGKDQTAASGLNFSQYDVQNNRVQYGEFNRFGLVTAAGEKGEYLPEQIGEAGDTSPTVRSISDPRPDGKPYFRFQKYLGDSSDAGFWVGCLGGMEWQNAPLVYSQASGSYMNKLNFTNGAQSAYNTYQNDLRGGYTGLAQQLTSKSGWLSLAVEGIADAAAGAVNVVKNLAGTWGSGRMYTGAEAWQDFKGANEYQFDFLGRRQTTDAYNVAREKELQNYGMSQSVVVPTVLFPFNANVIRDFQGNGVFVYRYKYTDSDAQRIDKLLTMYGYKDTVALTADLFNTRTYFDYVRAGGISVGGDLPLWMKSGITEQLNAGVRVWHVKPDPTHYSSNPIKTA